MSKLFKRYCRLTIAEGKENQKAIDFSRFRLTFVVNQTAEGKPRSAEIKIYNVNSETVSRIRQEGQKVILEAGYEENHAVIFQGELIQRYRMAGESQNDTLLKIVAKTNDQAHTYAVVNASVPAGASPVDIHETILSGYAPYGVVKGYLPELSAMKLPRGKVLFCPAKDAMTGFCKTHRLQFNYLDKGLACVPVDGIFPGQPFVLNERTGLIGTPQMSIDGLTVTSLLRPEIRMDTTLQIENDTVLYDHSSEDVRENPTEKNRKQQNSLDVNGIYKVISLVHTGDTYGTSWHSKMICVAANPSQTDTAGKGRN